MRSICRYILSLFFIALSTISCLHAQSGAVHDTETLSRVKALIQDFDSLYLTEPERARGLIYQAVHTSRDNGFTKEQAESYYRLGKLYFNTGQYDSARTYIEAALPIYKGMNDARGVCLSLKDLGSVAVETGQHQYALDYYTRGLNLAKENGFDQLESSFINNLGLIYLHLEHFDKAQEHFERCAALRKEGYDYAIAINNIGVVKQKQGEFSEAIEYYRKSLEACQEAGDAYCSLTPMNGLAGIYLHIGEPEWALIATEGIIELQGKLKLDKDLIISYNRMGLIYNSIKEYLKAIEYYHKSLSIAHALQSALTPYIYANLSDTYANNGQFEEALKFSTRFYEMKDSIYSVEHKIKTEELLTQYEAEKKEKEIALLRKDRMLREIELEKNRELLKAELLDRELKEQENRYNLLQSNQEIEFLKKDKALQDANILNKQHELERQTYIRNITIISAVLIFIPTFILMIVYQQKVRNRELLAQRTEEVNKQKTLEMIRNFELKTIRASIEGEEKEKRRIARELHDGVAGTLAGIKMRFQALGKSFDENEKFRKLIQRLDEAYQEVRTISHHLSPPGMMKHSFVGFIEKYLYEISTSANFDMQYFFYGKEYLNELSDDVKVEVYRILQELISNILKHAKTDFTEIQLVADNDSVTLIVEDRGVGFSPASRIGGFGLQSIKSRVDGLGGELHIDAVPERGTIVQVYIPVSVREAQVIA